MSKEVVLINQAQAKEIFQSLNGCSFIGLTISTIPVLLGGKKNEHQGRIRKNSVFTVYCGSGVSYEKTVQKKGVKVDPENFPTFKAEALWKGNGKHIGGAIVSNENLGTDYIYYYVAMNSKPDTDYTLDGKQIEQKDIQGLKASTSTKTIIGNDGEEIKIRLVVRTTKLENIKSFRLDGKNYVIQENI